MKKLGQATLLITMMTALGACTQVDPLPTGKPTLDVVLRGATEAQVTIVDVTLNKEIWKGTVLGSKSFTDLTFKHSYKVSGAPVNGVTPTPVSVVLDTDRTAILDYNNGGAITRTITVEVTGVTTAPVTIKDSNGNIIWQGPVTGSQQVSLKEGQTYTITPETVNGATAPAPVSITVTGDQTVTLPYVTAAPNQPVTVTVIGPPSAPVTITNNNGATVWTGIVTGNTPSTPINLPDGTYTVTPGGVPGYTTPAPQTLILTGQPGNVTLTYPTAPVNTYPLTIDVNGVPSAVVTITNSAGATVWTGTVQQTTNVVQQLPNGTYTVTGSPVTGYTTPAPQRVTINGSGQTATLNYVTAPVNTYPLTVDVNGVPSAVVTITNSAGATVWTGTVQQTTNAVQQLPNGTYTVTGSPVTGYTTPAPQRVTINGSGQTATLNYAVAPVQTYPVVIDPSGVPAAPITITNAGGTVVWQGTITEPNTQTVQLPNGTYTVNSGPVTGYTAPAPIPVTVNNAGASANPVYTANPTPTYTLTTTVSGVSSAPITVTDSAGNVFWTGTVSGSQTIPGLTPGATYTVTPGAVPGYNAPTPTTFTATQNTTVNNIYTASTVALTLIPEGVTSAPATVTDSAGNVIWSGTVNGSYTIPGLSPGASYTITPGAVSGYNTPVPGTIVLTSDGTTVMHYTPTTVSTHALTIAVSGVPSAPMTLTDASGVVIYNGNVSGSTTVTGLTDGQTYTVTPGAVSGYTTPAPQQVLMNSDRTISASYGSSASQTLTVNVTGVPTAQVTVSDSTGSTVWTGSVNGSQQIPGLLTGQNYTVTFGAVAGYTTPAPQAVNMSTNQSVTGAYVP